jgi:catechol 2,3-dioxygenase-like lactoylglutathione lyase family enzyme
MALDIRGLIPLIQVFDMPTSLHFYRDMLGFEVVHTSKPGDNCGWAMLRLGAAQLMLNTAYEDGQRPPKPDAARTAAHEDTGLFFACPDIEETYQQLRAKGVDVKGPEVRDYGMKQLYVTDPDGYVLCFQWQT